MPLATIAQYDALQADILADPAFAGLLDPNGEAQIAKAYNTVTANFWVWRDRVLPDEYCGQNGVVWTAVDTLTVGKARIFDWLTGGLTRPLNFTDSGVRAGISEAFGAASTSTSNLLAVGRRLATRAEKLFAAGTGTVASPALLAFKGSVSSADIFYALNPSYRPSYLSAGTASVASSGTDTSGGGPRPK